MAKTTLKDISKALNISISTVSKALADSYEISEKTKKIVQEYASKMNFSPNKVAQSLKIGKTNTIGVIVCAINNTFMSEILDGIQKASIETGYDIVIMQSREDIMIEKACIEVLNARGIDGLLISPVSETSNINLLQELQENETPVVIFDRIVNQLKTDKVGINNFEGAYKATKHLIEQGRTNILHITGHQLGVSKDRLNGYKDALREFDIPLKPYYFIECNIQDTEILDQQIKTAILKALSSDNKPNAIFGATDVITTRTLGILANLGIKVPEEIAVIGFSNISIPFALNPALSRIKQPAGEIGNIAMKKLIYLIKHPTYNDFETVELETILEIRKSSSLN
ncbi:LacI family transcriptional regulator [Sphingobacterium sp. SRCM116780]|uniref:LacI family DNA-binding transcriptional regulator n=1 Tax=Sphingobacterium sp. SRCM116780 TaxID=2907623 RepID=UPI001F2FEC3D|nr:LacI family DNA-binding transcriptional regulator [Sphingobacterium sp. SRCM116780]UIR56403.1 LacI family transcriptional regulator [Sphingobacterium sp. SRCM116780]